MTVENRRRVHFNLSPLAFHGWADQYLQEYRDLAQSSHASPAPYLLLCRVIELELKAWHRQRTKQNVLADRFRHDLLASYRALPAPHRILSIDELDLLTRVNEIYSEVGLDQLDGECIGRSFELPRELAALKALAHRVMEHGDSLNLAS